LLLSAKSGLPDARTLGKHETGSNVVFWDHATLALGTLVEADPAGGSQLADFELLWRAT
jgi:hypothetical protein